MPKEQSPRKPKVPKTKRYALVLNECELRRLTAYAEVNGTDRRTALGRLVRQALRDAAAGIKPAELDDERQLKLFDTVQIDLFNNTTKVNYDKI